MTVLDALQQRAKVRPAHIVLSEGHDPRIVAAAIAATTRGIAEITLVGDAAAVTDALTAAGGKASDTLHIADPATHPRAADIATT